MLEPIENLFTRRNEGKDSHSITEPIRFKLLKLIIKYRIEIGNKRSALVMSGFTPYYNELEEFVDSLEFELGIPISNPYDPVEKRITDFLFNCKDNEFLTSLEILMAIKFKAVRRFQYESYNLKTQLDKFIEIINKIFRIDEVPYEILEFSNEDLPYMIMPLDSHYLHEESIKKPLSLLSDLNFEGALDEFEHALDEYRKDHYKNSIRDAQKSYESTLKSILTKKGINYDEKDKIPSLVKKVQNNAGLLDKTTQAAFESLWSIFIHGTSKIRNQEGVGHGQGLNIKNINKSYARFVLNLVGSYIVFLIERYDETED
ncbi:abortive infection family protein [Methanobacterium aggregans]|uniref:abortive infection family protein n=1 Tax=Methanobacterium aggregans TaxID=1615586 RepID=UPI001AE89E55|nr:abortive infection family protein [Methanobacterium aggregans]MBP2045290.1 tetratricopeptide (TPR) repeat protein [Methanobacterium aggregans]